MLTISSHRAVDKITENRLNQNLRKLKNKTGVPVHSEPPMTIIFILKTSVKNYTRTMTKYIVNTLVFLFKLWDINVNILFKSVSNTICITATE